MSPILLIFFVPVAIGIGLDIFRAGEAPLVLALCGPLAVVLLHRVVPHAPLRDVAPARWAMRRNR